MAIEYMLTGSLASSLQGEPRSTHDIDLVIAIERTAAHRLLDLLPPPRFYLDEKNMLDAIDGLTMFSLIDADTGGKVDFWLFTGTPFDRSRFSRRSRERFLGMELCVSSPEDTILAKLHWAKLSGGSEKHFADALRVYEVQAGVLDADYLAHWVRQLNVDDLWERIQAEAEVL
ncbi:MAG: hypothetical protein RDU89_10325 [bacterium]|nr:hypothetical protein [bacterium]